MDKSKQVAIIGAGIFGLSLAVALREKGHQVTVFDRYKYDDTAYREAKDPPYLAASVDFNKIFRASYGTKILYQRLALESRDAWQHLDEQREGPGKLLVNCGMLRVQPTVELGALEKETLANMERDGLRDKQFVRSIPSDRRRAAERGWDNKLMSFEIPGGDNHECFEAVLDSLAGFTTCSDACAYYLDLAIEKGVRFCFGLEAGYLDSILEESTTSGQKKAIGIRTKDGRDHRADTVVVAAGSFSTQVLPEVAYHLESSAGSIATFKIDKGDADLWDKYSPEKFPVITWKNTARDKRGRDTGSIYVLPRTPEGLIKIGYRGIKYTNFEKAPDNVPFTQDGQWSVPLPAVQCIELPGEAVTAIRTFVSIFLPEFTHVPFHSTKLCWYTDSLDNSFLIDYVPKYDDRSVFVCTGGSGHGAKFLPVLGKHAADIFENGDQSETYMRESWRWREDKPRGNGLEEGPGGPRDIKKARRQDIHIHGLISHDVS